LKEGLKQEGENLENDSREIAIEQFLESYHKEVLDSVGFDKLAKVIAKQQQYKFLKLFEFVLWFLVEDVQFDNHS
jgi:hypothetical protein